MTTHVSFVDWKNLVLDGRALGTSSGNAIRGVDEYDLNNAKARENAFMNDLTSEEVEAVLASANDAHPMKELTVEEDSKIRPSAPPAAQLSVGMEGEERKSHGDPSALKSS